MLSIADARQRVLDTCLALAQEGFLPGTGGNVALKVDDQSFAVTPSAADYYSMTPDDICILNLHTLKPVDAKRKPSVESGLHARLLRYRPEFTASIHTHQPTASAVTLINQSLPVTGEQEQSALGSVVPLVPYAPSGTWFLARAFEKTLTKNSNAYLLKNHGIVCGGKNLQDAMQNVRLLERLATNFLKQHLIKHAKDNPHATDILAALPIS